MQNSESNALHKKIFKHNVKALPSKCIAITQMCLLSVNSMTVSQHSRCKKYIQKKIRGETQLIILCELFIQLKEIGTVFDAQGEISKSFHKSCLEIPRWRQRLEWESIKQSLSRLPDSLKTLQVECWHTNSRAHLSPASQQWSQLSNKQQALRNCRQTCQFLCMHFQKESWQLHTAACAYVLSVWC